MIGHTKRKRQHRIRMKGRERFAEKRGEAVGDGGRETDWLEKLKD